MCIFVLNGTDRKDTEIYVYGCSEVSIDWAGSIVPSDDKLLS